jgi:hypothetical protein
MTGFSIVTVNPFKKSSKKAIGKKIKTQNPSQNREPSYCK